MDVLAGRAGCTTYATRDSLLIDKRAAEGCKQYIHVLQLETDMCSQSGLIPKSSHVGQTTYCSWICTCQCQYLGSTMDWLNWVKLAVEVMWYELTHRPCPRCLALKKPLNIHVRPVIDAAAAVLDCAVVSRTTDLSRRTDTTHCSTSALRAIVIANVTTM